MAGYPLEPSTQRQVAASMAPPAAAPAPVESEFGVARERRRSRTSISPGPATLTRGGRSAAALAVPQVPRILHAIGAGATRRQHALVVRGEGAARAAAARTLVLDAPGAIDFGNARTRIDGGQRADREQGKRGSDR